MHEGGAKPVSRMHPQRTWRGVYRALLLLLACTVMPEPRPDEDGGAPEDDAGVAADAGHTLDSGVPPWPLPRRAGTCTVVRTNLPNNTWENAAVFDSTTNEVVLSGGHVLGGYAQSPYTFRFAAPDFATRASHAASQPQRRCLVDGAFASSIGQSVYGHGLLEHGSINPGHFKSGFTTIGLAETPGPWLYDSRRDTWVDARPLGTAFDQRQHAPMTYDPATDTVVSLRMNALQLFHVATNQVLTRPIPRALEGRLFYAIAADPVAKRLVVFGGSQGHFLWAAGDAGANWEALVKDDTWLYDPATDTWDEVQTTTRPPRGVPGQDFSKLSASWEPVTGNVLVRVNPLSVYERDARRWPAAETWAFNVTAREWTKLELDGPPFIAQLVVDPVARRVLLIGGGADAVDRPSLSRELRSCTLPTAGPELPAIAPTDTRVQTFADGGVLLEWSGAIGDEVFRAALATNAPWPGAFVKVGNSSDGRFFDTPSRSTWAYEVRRNGARVAAPVVTRPPRPEGLRVAVVSGTRVALSWNAVASGLTYRVHRARGGATGVALGMTTGTTYDDQTVDLSDGVARRYWVTAVNAGGIESGASPQAFSFPEAPLAPDATSTSANTVRVTWQWPAEVPVLRFEVFHLNEHRNTLSESDPFGPTGWYGQMQATTPTPVAPTAREFVFTIPANETRPHHYFWVKAVNVLGQAGFTTDLVSATDWRFVPQASSRFAPP